MSTQALEDQTKTCDLAEMPRALLGGGRGGIQPGQSTQQVFDGLLLLGVQGESDLLGPLSTCPFESPLQRLHTTDGQIALWSRQPAPPEVGTVPRPIRAQ